MDELFFYGLQRVEELIDDIDTITKVKIRENLRVMYEAYDKQRQKAKHAECFEDDLRVDYDAVRKFIAEDK